MRPPALRSGQAPDLPGPRPPRCTTRVYICRPRPRAGPGTALHGERNRLHRCKVPLSRHRLERGRWSGAGWPLRLARPVCPAAGRGRAGSLAGWRGAGGGAWPGLFYVSLTGRRGDAAALPKPCSKRFGKCAASSFHGFEPGPPCFLGEGEEEGGERTRHPQSAGRLRPPPPRRPHLCPRPSPRSLPPQTALGTGHEPTSQTDGQGQWGQG